MGGAEGNTGTGTPPDKSRPACERGTGEDSAASGETNAYRLIATVMVC